VETLIPKHEELSKLPSHKRPLLRGTRLLLLGAIAGSISAFWSYKALIDSFGINFPVLYVLACLVISAFSGIGVTSIADEHGQLRWLALVVAIFIGVMIPFSVYLVLSFLAGPT